MRRTSPEKYAYRKRIIVFVLGVAGILLSGGCSSSLFSDPTKSTELQGARGTGNFNKKCLGLNLVAAHIDVPTAVGLVDCLNSNDSIPEYAALVHKMNDRGLLSPVLDVLNQELVSNAKRVRELDQSFRQMDERGITARVMDATATVLENGKLAQSLVRFLLETSTASSSRRVLSFFSPTLKRIDPALVSSVRVLVQELSDDGNGGFTVPAARKRLGRALEFATMLTSSQAYRSTVKGLNSSIPLLGDSCDFRCMNDLGLQYLKSKINADDAFLKVLLWGIVDGSALTAFDYYFDSECDTDKPGSCSGKFLTLHEQVQSLEEFVRVLTVTHRETILKPLIDLFREMDGPVDCMASTKRVPNMDMFVLGEFLKIPPREVPAWVMKTNALKISVANSMCILPSVGSKTFNEANKALRGLTEFDDIDELGNHVGVGRPLITVAHFTKGLEIGDQVPLAGLAGADLLPYMANYPSNERLRRLLIHWLGDKSEETAYTHLADAVAELARPERAVLGNVLYLLNISKKDSKDRDDLRDTLRALMQLRPDLKTEEAGAPGSQRLNQRSVYDVLAQAILRADSETLYQVLKSLGASIDNPKDMAVPFLSAVRDALLMNDATPILEIVLSIGLHAEDHQQFFDTIAEVASTDEFVRALQLTGKMAANGTLRELLQGILGIFRGSPHGEAPPSLNNVPPVRLADPERDCSTVGCMKNGALVKRPNWTPASAVLPAETLACRSLDFDVLFGDPFSSRNQQAKWETQAHNIAACINSDKKYPEVVSLFNYGLQVKVKDGKHLLGFLTELLGDLIPGPHGAVTPEIQDVYDELSDLVIAEDTRADIKRTGEVLKFLFEEGRYCSAYPSKSDASTFARVSNSCGVNQHIALTQAVGRVMGSLANDGKKLAGALDLVKTVVESEKAPKPLALIYDVAKVADTVTEPIKPDERPPLVSVPVNAYPKNQALINKLQSVAREYEGKELTPLEIAEREADFWHQPQSHQRHFYDYNGAVRIGFRDVNELKSQIRPLLEELSIGNRIEWATKDFFHMFGTPYTPDWWANWFRRAANNVTVIPYYYPEKDKNGKLVAYPGNAKPKARFVSELDVLELIVLDGDFNLVDEGQFHWQDRNVNFAIKYLGLIAQCGDDISPALDRMWRELDQFQTIAKRTEWLPGPVRDLVIKPDVRRRLFNLSQVYPLLRAFNRVTEYKNPDGRTIHANDLGVLRDLFKAVLSATPEADREKYYTNVNSLTVIIGLVKSGILRNAAANMWSMNPNANKQTRVNFDDDDANNREVVPAQVSSLLRVLVEATVIPRAQPLNVPGLDELEKKFHFNPDTVAVLGYLLRQDCNKKVYGGKPCTHNPGETDSHSFDDRFVFLGKILNQLYAWTADDDKSAEAGKTATLTLMKRASYTLTLLLERLAIDSSGMHSPELNRKFARVLRAFLANPRGTEIIGDHVDLLESVINDAKTTHFLQLLLDSEYAAKPWRARSQYEPRVGFSDLREMGLIAVNKLADAALFDDTPDRNRAIADDVVDLAYDLYKSPHFDAAKSAFNMMGDDPEWIAFKDDTFNDILDRIIHWFERPGAARPRLREFLAKHIANGDVQALVQFLADESAKNGDIVYNQIKFIGKQDYIDDLNGVLDLLSSGPVDVYPPARETWHQARLSNTGR